MMVDFITELFSTTDKIFRHKNIALKCEAKMKKCNAKESGDLVACDTEKLANFCCHFSQGGN